MEEETAILALSRGEKDLPVHTNTTYFHSLHFVWKRWGLNRQANYILAAASYCTGNGFEQILSSNTESKWMSLFPKTSTLLLLWYAGLYCCKDIHSHLYHQEMGERSQSHIWSQQWFCTEELKETLSLMCTTQSPPLIQIRTFPQRRFCWSCSIASVTL